MARTVRNFAFRATRERYGAASTNADGFQVGTVVSSQSILIHMHPAKGDDLQRLPEGVERRGVYQGYTPAELELGDEATQRRPDVVVAFGKRYEVVESSPWSGGRSGSQTWRQCLLVEVDR